MGNMVSVWSSAKIAFIHSTAGRINPGKNILEDRYANPLINDGVVSKYVKKERPRLVEKVEKDVRKKKES